MPFDGSPSPVAPPTSSRLWSMGAVTAVSMMVLVVCAVAYPQAAIGLLCGALAVGVVGLMTSRATRLVEQAAPAAAASDAPLLSVTEGMLLDKAFESLRDPVLVLSGGEVDDIAGRRVLLANAAARELLRIPREGALLVSAMRDPGVLEAVDEALFGGVERQTPYAAAGARTRHWSAWVGPLACPDGRPLALLILRDETDVRRMELMRVDFLANASHELRTPLASLSGFIETLKGHAREDAVARDRFLDIMAAQADRMTRLVADLLSLSRIELNENIPPSGRVDVGRACTDVIDAVSVLSQARAVQIDLSPATGTQTVQGDRDEIVQVIQNLIDNAIKYSPRDGRVAVSIEADLSLDEAAEPRLDGGRRLPLLTPDREAGRRYVAVSVRDFGPGMAREHLPRLTERFYRVEGQKSGDRSGTGLGLAIVKHILNRHRGGLIVESVPEEGTVFTAYLPLPDNG